MVVAALLRAVFDIRVHGEQLLPRTGPLILASNHSSFLDGPLVVILAPRQVRALAKSELFTGPLARMLYRAGQIPIDRGRPDRAALRAALAVLADGDVLGVFPEGTRGSGNLDAVQDGIAYLAARAGCPVAPVAFIGTAEALPRGSHRPLWRARIDIVFGPPFRPDLSAGAGSRAALRQVSEDIRRHLADHLSEARGRSG